jgi:hypothetical protein
MKRLAAALISAVVLAFAAGASPALGDSSPNKVPYQAGPYSMGVNGDTDWWTCSGFRLDAGSTVQDHFHCTVTDQTFTGTFTARTPWPCGCVGWASDYDAQFTNDYVIRVSSNGRVVGTAIYSR